VQLQHAVDTAVIHVLRNPLTQDHPMVMGYRLKVDQPVASSLQMFPDPPHRDDEYVHFINDYFPMVLLVSFMLAVAAICKDIVSEKEKKLKVRPRGPVDVMRPRRRGEHPENLVGWPKRSRPHQ